MIESVVIVVTESITWKILDDLLQYETICDVGSLATAPLYGDAWNRIYILLTSERKMLECYDLWDSRKKDEEPWKI
jgi:hypothetical protein